MGLFNFWKQSAIPQEASVVSQPEVASSRKVIEDNPATSDGTIWAARGPSVSGVAVDETSTVNISTVYSCVSLRAQVMACLPIKTYRKSQDGNREAADQHPSNWLWSKSPDEFMTAFNTRETIEGHKLLRGNSYMEVSRNFRGQANSLYLLDPRKMTIELPARDSYTSFAKDGSTYPIYRYSDFTGPPANLDITEVVHFTNWSMDGFYGVPPLTVFRESVGLTIAANIYANQYFRKGGYPLGFLTKPGVVGKDLKATLFQEWQEMHGGLANAHNVGILSGGMDWKSIGVSNQDAQLLGLRQFQKYELAQLFRVPPFLLGDVEQPLSDIEFIMIQFVMFSILPEMRRNENELNRKMFTPKEQFNYYMEYNADGLLRGDAKSRAEALQIEARNGALLINEWREMANRNKVENGDIPLIMASQLATLEAVANGTANLDTTSSGGTNNKTSTGRDKTKQLNRESNFNRTVYLYLKLDEDDRRRFADVVFALNNPTPKT